MEWRANQRHFFLERGAVPLESWRLGMAVTMTLDASLEAKGLCSSTCPLGVAVPPAELPYTEPSLNFGN